MVGLVAWAGIGCGAGAGGASTGPDGGSRSGGVNAGRRSIVQAGQVGTASGVGAFFYEIGVNFDALACQSQVEDGCTLLTCRKDGADGGSTGQLPTPWPHAGRITLTAEGQSVVLEPDATGRYQAMQQIPSLWQPGSTVAVEAAGATVPAFSSSLTAPGDVTITMPSPTQPTVDGRVVIARDVDLPVAWTGGSTGEVILTLIPDDAAKTVALICRFPASAGRGTVGKAQLAKLPAAPGVIEAAVGTYEDKSKDGWKLTFSLSGSASAIRGSEGIVAPARFQ